MLIFVSLYNIYALQAQQIMKVGAIHESPLHIQINTHEPRLTTNNECRGGFHIRPNGAEIDSAPTFI
jgi:hypothetical protein